MTRPCTYKSRLVSSGWSRSALPPEADIRRGIKHVCFVPESGHWEKQPSLSWSELKLGVGKHRSRHNRRLTMPPGGIRPGRRQP